MSLTTAANAMNVQTDLKAAELKDIAAQDFLKKKNWSDSATSEYVTTFAEGLLKSVTNRVSMYRSKKMREATFQVEFTGSDISRTQKLQTIMKSCQSVPFLMSLFPFLSVCGLWMRAMME